MPRREINVFSISFLDCICCGFGAIVLLFVLINARARAERTEKTEDLSAVVQQLQAELLEGRKDLIVARNTLQTTESERVETKGAADRIEKTLAERREELAQFENTTISRTQHVNRLKADIRALEEDYKRLKAAAAEGEQGTRVKEVKGDGDRQYLTGVRVGGERILLLVDASASMLGEKLVDIIIRRNLPPERRRASPKWQKVVSTVDWVTSQFPSGSQFQIYTFHETAQALVDGTDGTWLECGDPEVLRKSMEALRQVVPDKGTSLHAAFDVLPRLKPRPDNVFLITDGLPTMPERKPGVGRVSAAARLRFFNDAIRSLPRDVPVNTILMVMEGDPMAAGAFWRLATMTQGSFFSPSVDWP